jgi:hypothetical protein
MFGQTWSHDLIRKYVIIFGTLFNNIYLTRNNANGTVAQTIKVPLTYAPKEKMLARLTGDPSLTNQVALTLPRMSFEILGYQYDGQRKLNTIEKITKKTETDADYVYNPVPYDFQFLLHIMVKNAADGTRIVEQILPYFTPEFTVTANILPSIAKSYDIPVVLYDTIVQDLYDGSFQQRRTIVWTLSFSMKGYLFGPIKSKQLIRFANVGLTAVSSLNNLNNIDRNVTITVQPGQTANGQATSNVSQTVDYLLVDPNDPYGFIQQFDENI